MRGIVFDFDGVICQSMESHAEAYADVMLHLGVSITRRDVLLREGARSETILHDLLVAAGLDPADHDLDALAQSKQEAFLRRGAPPLYPGATAMVEVAFSLTQKVGLVTGTRRVNLEALIPQLLPRFAAVLSQEDYTHDKPHPEPYARAADQLGLPAADCVAVENALRGVESARAAGYGKVLAIATTLSNEDLRASTADEVLADHDAVAQSLAHLWQQD